MTCRYYAEKEEDLDAVAARILSDAGGLRVFALYGEMGAGKTTLVKALCRSLGVKQTVTSPTFSILNEYINSAGLTVYHFDFYRIKELSEAYDLGYENYVFSGSYCFIEWPEKVESLLNIPKAAIFITSENNRRNIELRTD